MSFIPFSRVSLSLVCCSALYYVSVIPFLGNSLSHGSASLGQSQENSQEDKTWVIQGDFLTLLIFSSDICVNKYSLDPSPNQGSERPHRYGTNFDLEEIHFSRISYCFGQRQGPSWVVDTGQWIFSQLSPKEIKLIVKKFNSLSHGQF